MGIGRIDMAGLWFARRGWYAERAVVDAVHLRARNARAMAVKGRLLSHGVVGAWIVRWSGCGVGIWKTGDDGACLCCCWLIWMKSVRGPPRRNLNLHDLVWALT